MSAQESEEKRYSVPRRYEHEKRKSTRPQYDLEIKLSAEAPKHSAPHMGSKLNHGTMFAEACVRLKKTRCKSKKTENVPAPKHINRMVQQHRAQKTSRKTHRSIRAVGIHGTTPATWNSMVPDNPAKKKVRNISTDVMNNNNNRIVDQIQQGAPTRRTLTALEPVTISFTTFGRTGMVKAIARKYRNAENIGHLYCSFVRLFVCLLLLFGTVGA